MFSLFIMIIQNSFTIIPLLFVITLNYYLFGFFYGFIWSWFSSILAAMIIFLAVRYWFQEIVPAKKYVDLLKRMETRGIYYVIYGRIFPFFPTSILNIIAGISMISFKSFIIGTAIGNFFYFFILALIPLGLFSMEIHPVFVALIILCTIIVFYSIKKMKPRCWQNIKKIKQRF